jgi:uncharacterized membrane protein
MRKYLFGTGLISAVTGGITLMRGSRDSEFTWREALAWLNWLITAALVIGAIVDTQRASRGHAIADDSPVHGKEEKLLKKRLRK